MSMLHIKKYTTISIDPEEDWYQVDSNPTAIAIILTTIDNLEENESIVITKEKRNNK